MKKPINKNWFPHEMEYHIELFGIGQWDDELTLQVSGEIYCGELDGFLVGVFNKYGFQDFEPFLNENQVQHIKEAFYESAMKAYKQAIEQAIKDSREAIIDHALEKYKEQKKVKNQ
jgi:hypothetical protein